MIPIIRGEIIFILNINTFRGLIWSASLLISIFYNSFLRDGLNEYSFFIKESNQIMILP